MIAIVPIRAGSKEIKNKNTISFNGKPLVWWILNALSNTSVSKIIVALDDPYFEIVESFNFSKVISYKRNPLNSRDDSSTEDVLLEVIEKFNIDDDVILAQATSPLTLAEEIEKGIKIYNSGKYDSVLSVVKLDRFIWDRDGTPINYDFTNRPRRQDFKGTFFENGAFYINKSKRIIENRNRLSGKIGFCEMNFKSFFEIDTNDDLKLLSILGNQT